MFCSVCGAESTTEAEQRAHINTTRHLIAARKMWERFLKQEMRHTKPLTKTVREAEAAVEEINRRLALLTKKEA